MVVQHVLLTNSVKWEGLAKAARPLSSKSCFLPDLLTVFSGCGPLFSV